MYLANPPSEQQKMLIRVPDPAKRGEWLLVDVVAIIETYYCLVDANGELMPFKLNEPQRRFMNMLAKDWNAGKPVRFIILKARQMGFSTLIEAVISVLTAFQGHKKAAIVTEDPDSSTSLFEMSKGFVANWRGNGKPQLLRNNGKKIQFADTKSIIEVIPAENARGGTRQYIHRSECAFWSDPDKAENALDPSIHDLPYTIDIKESTANGYNKFKKDCDDARAGDSDYTFVFFPWFELDEYRAPYDGFELTNEEKEIKARFNLDNEQIAWRRKKVKSKGLAWFHQEYPATPEEAFVSTGFGLFDAEKISAQKEKADLFKPRRGRFEFDHAYSRDGNHITVSNIKWVDDDAGPVRIYVPPVDGMQYAIGGDTADGGSDFFAADCSSAQGKQQCATFHQNGCKAFDFAMQLYCMGRYYNNALLGTEVNKNRAVMIDNLAKTDYENLYISHEETSIDQNPDNKWGLTTTNELKHRMVEKFRQTFFEHPETVVDMNTLSEMQTFVAMPSPSGATTTWGASSSRFHDDTVMARAICLHVMEDIRIAEVVVHKQTVGEWVDDTIQKEIENERRNFKPW